MPAQGNRILGKLWAKAWLNLGDCNGVDGGRFSPRGIPPVGNFHGWVEGNDLIALDQWEHFEIGDANDFSPPNINDLAVGSGPFHGAIGLELSQKH